MSTWSIGVIVILFLLLAVVRLSAGDDVTAVGPEEAARRVAAGTAVLIDVREATEWADGVAEPALLLSLSDLRGERETWKPVLAANREKELILYCRSGHRSGIAAKLLAKEGFHVANAGGFSAWRNAKLPERKP